MEKTVLFLKRETSTSVREEPKRIPFLAGYLLRVSVDIAHNIDRNIFVMQRDLASSYSQEQMDIFYSIASVGEMEWVPVGEPDADRTNFYRTDSIELMFESKKELEDAWKKISGEVYVLAESNDISINTQEDVYAVYPNDAIYRHYGTTVASPSQAEIESLPYSLDYGSEMDIVDTFNGTDYFTVAQPTYSKNNTLFIDNVLALCNESDITLNNKYGVPILYKVFTTKDPVASGLRRISFRKMN